VFAVCCFTVFEFALYRGSLKTPKQKSAGSNQLKNNNGNLTSDNSKPKTQN